MDNDEKTDSNIIEFKPNGDLSMTNEKRRRVRRQANRDQHITNYLPADEILLMISDSFEDWADHLENLNDKGSIEFEDIGQLIEYLRDMKFQMREWLQ